MIRNQSFRSSQKQDLKLEGTSKGHFIFILELHICLSVAWVKKVHKKPFSGLKVLKFVFTFHTLSLGNLLEDVPHQCEGMKREQCMGQRKQMTKHRREAMGFLG